MCPRSVQGLVVAVLIAISVSIVPARHGAPVPETLLAGMKWRPIGPMRGGRTCAAAGHRSHQFTFYIGVCNGGIWKTTDAGTTWIPIFDDQPTQSIGALAIAPSDPNVIYAGSGESLHRPDLSVGDGLYRSSDAGRTWIHLGLRDAQQITEIAIDPRNPDRVFVAVLGHPYGPNAERGIYRSTDGGRTLTQVFTRGEDTGARDVDLDPSNPDVVYATFWEDRQGPWENAAWRGTNGGIFKSSDGGTTWRQLTNGLPRDLLHAEITIAPGNPRRLYAIVAALGGGGRGGGTGGGGVFYRSDDGGDTWTRPTNDNRAGNQRVSESNILVYPDDPDAVVVTDIVSFKSVDGGNTWVPFKGAPGGEDYQGGWINPDNPRIMLLIADQGAVVTLNGGETWSSWYNQPTAQLYHIAADAGFPYRVCSGQQESGSACVASRGNYGAVSIRDWQPVGVDEYGYVAPDPLDPGLVYGGRSVTRFDYRTGQTSTVGPVAGRGGAGPGAPAYRQVRTQPVVFSEADRRALFFGNNFLWKTVNGGISWQRISDDLTRRTHDAPPSIGAYTAQARAELDDNGARVIYAIGPSPIDVNRIWIGTDDGVIQTTTDGGKRWTDVTPPQIGSYWKVFMIDAGRFDTRTAYAAVNTLRIDDMRPHVYRTHDGGGTWTEIVDGMEDAGPVNTVREDPKRRGLLYASTERGVYVSFDDGARWQSLRLNLPATSVRDLIVKDDDLAVATHGRGFWILDDISPLRQLDPDVAARDAVLFKPADAWRVRWNLSTDMPWPKDEPTLPNPPEGAPINYYLKSAAAGPVVLEILTQTGRLVRRYSSADSSPSVPDVSTAPVPLYWYRAAQRLSADAGMHRFYWDLRHQPLGESAGGRGGLSIRAIPHNTVPSPTAPLVAPGTYTLRLTVDGRNYTESIAVRQDPRVTAPDAAVQQAYTLTRETYFGAADARAALERARDLRDQAARRLQNASGPAKAALEAFDKEVEAVAGSPVPPGGRGRGGAGRGGGVPAAAPVTLAGVAASLGALVNLLDSADVRPTENQVNTMTAAQAAAGRVMARWRALTTKELAALNRTLEGAGVEAIK
ncbi:MAG TPA: hypothetical protein VLD67_05250 [Vicinamibacterales bacterium]|nr:hypothetical protein [Vicinamibacterales bacterium]